MASKLLLRLCFCILFSFTATKAQAQTSRSNITLGSTLHTNSTPNFWPSPSKHFTLGFYPSLNGFKIGIWLVGTPKNTIVWTAQRNDPPLSPGAALHFSIDGILLLRNSSGQFQPISNNTLRASAASMLDSGNFVLYGFGSDIVWSSFDSPTDTLLVGQELVQYNFLYSSVSEDDRSTGNFRLLMQGDGDVNAFPVTSIRGGKYVYWTSSTAGAGENVSMNLGEDGHLYLKNSTGFSVTNLTKGGYSANDSVLYRATLDVDGILRVYQHQIGLNGSLNSLVLWGAISQGNRCSVKGICGLNSYCAIIGAEISCLCPPGFDFIDSNQTSKGCKLNFTAEMNCSNLNNGKESYFISSLPNTGFERNEYDILFRVSEDACSNACLEDCNCFVATFSDQLCFKHKFPLRYGYQNSSNPTKTLIKIRNGTLPPDYNIIITKKLGKEYVIVGIALSTFSLIIFLVSCYIFYNINQTWRYRIMARETAQPDFIGEINLRSFSYDQLVAATDGFKEEIGRGGSGKVYKGLLAGEIGGKEIAAKKLVKIAEEGESEFVNEMKIIGKTHHKNLVHLIGFCSEGSNRILVYEFMKNGSLGNLLFGSQQRPSWSERKRIAIAIARGIHYLHEECESPIIHCDIKPHNVLMDESWSPKISDFGLSKLLMPDQTRTYTVPRWTRGYGAPEWHKPNGPITVKSDVYSFGVLLFEIISCRKNLDLTVPAEEAVLMDWVYECYEGGDVEKVVRGEEEVVMEELEKMVKVGIWCVQTEVKVRPSMKSVMLMLEGTMDTPPPPSIYASITRL